MGLGIERAHAEEGAGGRGVSAAGCGRDETNGDLLARRGDGGMPLGEADRASPSARATRGTGPGSATPWGRLDVHSRGTEGGRSNDRRGRPGESARARGQWQGAWRHGRYGRRGGCSDSKSRRTLGVATGDTCGQGQGDGGPRAKEANVAAEPEVGGVGGRRGEDGGSGCGGIS
jgi:hypothetical protein